MQFSALPVQLEHLSRDEMAIWTFCICKRADVLALATEGGHPGGFLPCPSLAEVETALSHHAPCYLMK